MPALTFTVVIDSDVDIDHHDVRIALAYYFEMDIQRFVVSSSTENDRVVAGLADALSQPQLDQLLDTITVMQETITVQQRTSQNIIENMRALAARVSSLEVDRGRIG